MPRKPKAKPPTSRPAPEQLLLWFKPEDNPKWRPKTRGDCAKVARPCPYVACRYNSTLDIQASGSIRVRLDESALAADGVQNCALDMADQGPHKLEEIAKVMGVCRERVRQEINEAVAKLGPILQTRYRGLIDDE